MSKTVTHYTTDSRGIQRFIRIDLDPDAKGLHPAFAFEVHGDGDNPECWLEAGNVKSTSERACFTGNSRRIYLGKAAAIKWLVACLNKVAPEPIKCGTFSGVNISPEVRARMDADRAEAKRACKR